MSSGQAERVVNGWLKLSPNPLQTQLGNQVSQVDVFADDNGGPIYYVIYLQPAGFAIVPADDLVEPIIAFADDGTFDPSPDNPLGALVSRDIPGRIAAARNFQAVAGGSQQKKELTEQQVALEEACLKAQGKWAEMQDYSNGVGVMSLPSISDVRVAPLLQSKWSQSNECSKACYNYYTPPNDPNNTSNYPCGCVATAMAQYMRFWQYPTTGVGTGCFTVLVDGYSRTKCLRGGDGSGGPYSWANMVLDPSCSTTGTQRRAIGALTYDAGVASHMQYASGGSGAYIHDARTAMVDTFMYSNAIMGGDEGSEIGAGRNGMINPNLDWGNPVMLGIYSNSTGAGHAIVADGYGYDTATLYHHLNLGWAGSSDAWYNLPNIGTSYGFDTVDACIYNIYISGSGEIISGRVTDTSGNLISGATVTGVRTGGGTYNDTTDSNGIYALAKIPSSSTYAVSVTKSGYTFTNQNVTTGTSTTGSYTSGNKWGINFVGTVSGPSRPIAEPDTISATQGTAKTIDLQASDDGLPDPPGVLTYIITSLPSHGTLDDPATGAIRSVPYTLAGNGNQVVYTPCILYLGSDNFDFKANDGGTPPEGGDSSIATITINVQPPVPAVIYETNFSGGLPSGWTIVNGGNTSDTWTDTNPGGEHNSNWTGKFMIVDSNYAGYQYSGVTMDEQLITQSIDCSDLVDVTLRFKHYFHRWSNEKGDVDIRIGAGSWLNVARYQLADFEGQVVLDISSIADGKPNVKIRWHYYNAYWEWYWGIDDVQILASAIPEPMPGDFEPDCDVDFYDFAVFASAWLSSSGGSNWNPDCDIYGDGVIDGWDLGLLAENWLAGL